MVGAHFIVCFRTALMGNYTPYKTQYKRDVEACWYLRFVDHYGPTQRTIL